MSDISITLPDGNSRSYPAGTTGMDVAKDISSSLAKKAISCSVNGEHRDLSRVIESDSAFAIHTMQDDAQALELIRHDCAHIMARAVQELWPDTQVTIGPVIDNGWYYDFDRPEPFSTEDLVVIEKKMREIINLKDPVRREVWERDRAIQFYKDNSEPYKVELIESIPGNEDLSMYWHGDWQDLCRGPHLVHTAQVPGDAFKLMSVAGAYWRGNSDNAMLQRIYGVAFKNKNDLKAHLTMLEEAALRDHRKLGREMDLFHMQEEAPGQVFWHPNGWRIYTLLQDYMRRMQDKGGYVEVNTPQVVDRKLWEASGHWEKYQEHMFIVEVDEDHAREKSVNALKPMNCPCHVQVFNHGQRSYKDLPIRFAEFGSCHRYEPSGALHGLMRVRAFVQDDGHIFCREDQVVDEVKGFCALLTSVYKDLGFDEVKVRFSDRPEVRVGSDEVWDRAEKSLRSAADATGLEVEYNPGDGAFYGPKLDFVLKDAIGREWQTGTIQADFNLPERLDASYIGADDARHRPVMLHRAILGSFERFLGILIENYAGRFPLWLAPVQIVIATITSDADAYAEKAAEKMRAAGLRVEVDLRNEKINYKIREHSVGKIPVIAVVGRKEADEGKLALRHLGDESRQQEVISLDDAIIQLAEDATPPDLRT